jgi:DNA segregation ATPase FtsK/SpoIIIE, S-DNA-T family
LIITLFDRGKAFNLVLPDKVTGRYLLPTVDNEDTPIDLLAVEAENSKWYIKSNKNAYIKGSNGEKVGKVPVEPFKTYTIFRGDDSSALLYVEPASEGRNEFTRHIVTTDEIKIGRTQESNICFNNKLVSSSHCSIHYNAQGEGTIRDHSSANGTYVNGVRISEKTLEVGDVISIMGLRIIYNGKLLSLNNPHQSVFLDRHTFKPFLVEKPQVQEEEELDSFLVEEENVDLFFRSPRFKRDIERKTIKIDPPPQQNNGDETPLMLLLGPSITMGMASLFTGLFAVQNVMRTNGDIMYAIPTLIMSFSMLIGTVLWPILAKKHEKKKRIANEKIRQEKYRKYLKEMSQNIADECEYQSKILHENHIAIEYCLKRIRNRERNLWERAMGHNDFLKVRLGLGDIPLDAEIKYPEKKFTLEDDNLQEELYRLVESPKILQKVPVTLSLVEEKVTGMIGKRQTVTEFVKGVIFQLASLHSYDEVKMVFIYDKEEHGQWKFVKWLPHVWDEGKNIRFIASDANEVKELSAYFEKEINHRASMADQDLEEIGQHYVVFSMSKELAGKAEMVNLLLKEKKQIGFSLIPLYNQLELLPKECFNVVELSGQICKIYDKDDISGKVQNFAADIYLQQDAEEVAIELANIQLASSVEAYTLPEMITFLEMFGVGKVEHLNAPVRWKENNPTQTIETQIGVNRMGEPFMIDLHEKYHGPHGLIAGMTGSGKSEFIMTFILSLAVNYHPDEVAFILIDYKGGGMANAFLNLPHLAGTITNLDGAAVKRSLISIQSELKRRQAIFSETSRALNESNIDIYKYQKLYREGAVAEPLQHLFMISDEFAELKTQQPEFMDQLVSAARIGRSLGVHLILATQKPSGVVDDQIWSNSKFRISLKVQEKADSMEVIKRPDAAELSQTGRFYLQVGYNELFELGQSAWAGAPYYPAERMEKRKEDAITVIDNLGRVIKKARIDKQKGTVKNPTSQIDEVTKYLSNLAKQENIKVKPLWLEPIPENIYLDELQEKYETIQLSESFELNPIIGEYDDPANQRQVVLRLPLTQEGNTVVYGVAGSGKTTFLTTLIYSLMKEHTPEEVNLYLLDFGSETLSWYRESPHVGDVMLSHEGEKIDNLFKMLMSEFATRKKQFANYGGDFRTFNRQSSEKIPSIVIMIHNYAAFSEMYEQHEEPISYLTREGTKYGVYFIVTALNTGAIRYRLLQNFKQMYVLQLNDTTEYSGVLGNVDGVYPSKYKGRGIFKTENVYEFQIAQISQDATDLFSFVTSYCQDYQQKWNRVCAKRIPILPEQVDLNYLREEIRYHQTNRVPIGVEKDSLQICSYDFDVSAVNLVSSSTGDESTAFMQGLAEVISAKENKEVIAIDAMGSFGQDTNRLYKYVTGSREIEEMVVHLFTTLVYRNNTTKDAIAEGLEPPVFENITCIIDSFTNMNSQLSSDGKDKLKVFLERIDGLNVTIILSDAVDKLSAYTYEPWFQKQVSLNDGVWVGNGITDQYVLKISKITNDMYSELAKDFGYCVTKGKVKQVKLLTTMASEEGAVQYA